ncbi:hypothetical protein HNR53_003061 [Bacillus benzoevorans]|uniref:Uncharacterized protein n=1 Tax=Bacillus benzoevorans TaxID=1456 RepID=A0A7X0HUZ5_9BACI|nr:hypothetical protein [Bacillus benzoevorans]
MLPQATGAFDIVFYPLIIMSYEFGFLDLHPHSTYD